jgi:hypothetical protein
MRDSIGGNSKTLMFVNISPADYNSQESKMSLFFGQDVKQIKNEVKRNVEGADMQRMKEENEHLKRQINHMASSGVVGGGGSGTGHRTATTAASTRTTSQFLSQL